MSTREQLPSEVLKRARRRYWTHARRSETAFGGTLPALAFLSTCTNCAKVYRSLSFENQHSHWLRESLPLDEHESTKRVPKPAG